MVKQRSFTTYIGGRGGTGDTLYLSGYNAKEITALVQKTDAGAAGQVYAEDWLIKPYTYDVEVMHNDAPDAFYEFRATGGAFETTERVTGGAVAIAGPGIGITGGSAGAAIYQGQYGMIPPTNQAAIQGLVPLSQAEDGNTSWSFEAWVYRSAATQDVIIYLEANAAITQYLGIYVSSAGTVYITHTGALAYASPAGIIPMGGWTHLGLSYNHNAATISATVNGVSSGAGGAYVNLTTWATTQTILNNGAVGQTYLALVAAYKTAVLSSDDFLRHYNDLTQSLYNAGYVSTPATLTNAQMVIVQFANHGNYGWDSVTYALKAPLTAVLGIATVRGVFVAQVFVTEYDEGGGA